MSTLSLGTIEESNSCIVDSLNGEEKTLRSLSSIGLDKGSELTVCLKQEGSMLVSIKGSLYAISNTLAQAVKVSSI